LDRTDLISIVIVNFNLTESVRSLLDSIKKNVNDINYEVVIVDNNSSDRSIEILASEYPEFRFEFLNTNLGFGHGNNVGMRLSQCKYYLLLNPDTYLVDNLPLKLYNFAEKNKNIGIIGATLIYPDGNFQISTAKFPNVKQEIVNAIGLLKYVVRLIHWIKIKLIPKEYFNVDFVFGSCMFIRGEIIELLGGFDEDYFLFAEEADLCYRVKKDTSYKVIFWKGGKIVHLKSQITGKNELQRLKITYESKYKFFLKHYSSTYSKMLCFIISTHYFFRYLFLMIQRNDEKSESVMQTYLDIMKKCPYSKNRKSNLVNG
jgi:GT2 family glycosyltransferase